MIWYNWDDHMKTEIKTAIIFGIMIVGGVTGLSLGFSSLETSQTPITTEIEKQSSIDTLDKSSFKIAPDLVGIAHYINTTPEELSEEIKGKVILYDFWTYSCINCIRTIPYITAWNEKYADDGLLIIGVHSPEFEFEKDLNNVKIAVDKNGIRYPVVMDNEMKTWKAFENRYWPRKYIADSEGYIRYDHVGEGEYEQTEYVIPEELQLHNYYLGGTWKNLEGSMELVSDEGIIKLPYFAKEVNIVAANEAKLSIFIDGKPITSEYAGSDVVSGEIHIVEAGLYNIIKSDEATLHTLEIIVSNPGFEIYTLTFG